MNRTSKAVLTVSAVAAAVLTGVATGSATAQSDKQLTLTECPDLPFKWQASHEVAYDYEARTMTLVWATPEGGEVTATVSDDVKCAEQPGLESFLVDTREGERQTRVADCKELRALTEELRASGVDKPSSDGLVRVPREISEKVVGIEHSEDLRAKLGESEQVVDLALAEKVVNGPCKVWEQD